VDYRLVDADNHYYEAEDAWTRHGSEAVKRYVTWLRDGKKQYLMFGDTRFTGVPNAAFHKVFKAGVLHDRLVDLEQGRPRSTGVPEGGGADYHGKAEPIPDAYRNRDARLMVMDGQGEEKIMLFPTAGATIDHYFLNDQQMNYEVFHAFNRWLDEDWGFHYQERIFAAPIIPLGDPQLAAREVDEVLARGARVVSMRPGPAAGRPPADPVWDPMWSRLDEAGVLVAYHAYGGPHQYYDLFDQMYGRQPTSDPGYQRTFREALGFDRGIIDTTIGLVLGNLFGRFPNLHVASVEMGSSWIPYVLHTLDHAGGMLDRHIEAFGQRLADRPSDVFKAKISISPFPEEDILALVDLIGVDRVLFGSDFPHPESIGEPRDYAKYLSSLDAADVKKIMRDNTNALLAV
jgi:predicted TIM-barrel fold metal-dependent hydrolase